MEDFDIENIQHFLEFFDGLELIFGSSPENEFQKFYFFIDNSKLSLDEIHALVKKNLNKSVEDIELTKEYSRFVIMNYKLYDILSSRIMIRNMMI